MQNKKYIIDEECKKAIEVLIDIALKSKGIEALPVMQFVTSKIKPFEQEKTENKSE